MTDHAVVDGVDVDALARAAARCRDVDALVEGPPAMAATYLPGRRVPGVTVDGDTVTLQVRLRYGATVDRLDRELRSAVARLVPDRDVEIVVADVADPLAAAPPTGM